MKAPFDATIQGTKLAMRSSEMAKAIGVSERHLWQLRRDGHVPYVKLGAGKRQIVLYPVEEMKAWLSAQAKAEEGGTDVSR